LQCMKTNHSAPNKELSTVLDCNTVHCIHNKCYFLIRTRKTNFSFFLFSKQDAYTTEDIIYKWEHKDVKVEATQMAQFAYKRASLSTSVNIYQIGKSNILDSHCRSNASTADDVTTRKSHYYMAR